MAADTPNDIIRQILQRVPAGSLVRFRWACKYWFDLITRDHDFIKMHLLLHHSTQSMISMVSRHSVLISRKEHDTEKLFKSYLNYNTAREAKASSSSQVIIAFQFKPRHFYKVLGSCNGLILLHTTSYHLQEKTTLCNPSEAKLIIWNPCTNEYKAIPDSSIVFSRMLTYGLGYDRTMDDYKVIRIIYNFESCFYEIQVYTMGTNSWKAIVVSNEYRPFLSLSNGVFVNGALHWLNPTFSTILSFDIVQEHIQEVPIFEPPECDLGFIQLQVFEGSLCYTIVYTNVVEIWIMNKDYDGVNNDECSWTKLYTYTHDQPRRFHKEYSYRLLRFTKNTGEIHMLKNDKYLCLCSPNNDRVETIRMICDPYCSVKEVYTESLVSLKSGTYLYESRTERNKDQHEEKQQQENHLRKKRRIKDHLPA